LRQAAKTHPTIATLGHPLFACGGKRRFKNRAKTRGAKRKDMIEIVILRNEGSIREFYIVYIIDASFIRHDENLFEPALLSTRHCGGTKQ
jgi:hypothetical protein